LQVLFPEHKIDAGNGLVSFQADSLARMAFIRVGIPLCVRCHENFSDNDECLHDALQVLFPDHRGGTGNWLVSASADGLVQVMNLQSGMDEDEAFQVSSAAFCKI